MPEKLEPIYRCKCKICGEICEGEDEREVYEKALNCESKLAEKKIRKVGDTIRIDGEAVKIEKISIEEGSHKLRYWYFPRHWDVARYVYNSDIHKKRGNKR